MKAQNSGIGFFGILTLIFITLKLTGVITWSWWLVLLPAYGGLAIVLVIIVIASIFMLIGHLLKEKKHGN